MSRTNREMIVDNIIVSNKNCTVYRQASYVRRISDDGRYRGIRLVCDFIIIIITFGVKNPLSKTQLTRHYIIYRKLRRRTVKRTRTHTYNVRFNHFRACETFVAQITPRSPPCHSIIYNQVVDSNDPGQRDMTLYSVHVCG